MTNFLIEPERELHKFKMFKKFEEKESISGITQLKSSVQKGIRNKLKESYPGLEGLMDDFLPKKDAFKLVKCHDHLELLINSSGRLLFFRSYEGPWCPTLKLLHQYPFLLPQQRVDKGMVIKVRFGVSSSYIESFKSFKSHDKFIWRHSEIVHCCQFAEGIVFSFNFTVFQLKSFQISIYQVNIKLIYILAFECWTFSSHNLNSKPRVAR